MKLSRRTNAIILWIISLALLVGMVIMFTPSLGTIGAGGRNDSSSPALLVNEQPISELAVARAGRSPLYQSVRDGEVGEDLQLLLLDGLIDQEVLRQAAARVNVSGADVRAAVEDFRRANSVAGRQNDDRYLSLIGGAGYTDQTFRDALREQLRVERFQAELTGGVSVSDAEVEAYYQVNEDAYRSEPRIEARMITVEDADLAEQLRAELESGADFAELARENSVERAERGGALGAAEGESEPRPVGRAALPNAVASVAFGLEGEGLTEVVEAGGRYHLVQVESYLPAAVQPLDEVRAEVEADALAAKEQQALEDEIERLRAEADVTIPEASSYSFDDPVVARVGDTEILASDLARATYSNPQIQQALNPQTADLIASFFKPSTLAQLIDIELAYQGAQQLEQDFIGSRAQVAQQAFDVVTRDAEATDEEIATYYEANLERYTVPASAEVRRVDFGAVEAATAFRTALLEGESVEDAAATLDVEVEDLGTVAPGQLADEFDTALFATDAFEPLPESDLGVSDVLVIERPAEPAADEAGGETPGETGAEAGEETGEEAAAAGDEAADAATTDEAAATAEGEATDAGLEAQPGDESVDQPEPGSAEAEVATEEVYVVLVADREPERVQPLDEVRGQVETAVLSQERAELREAWLAELQQEIEVVNLLETDPAASDDGSGDGAEAGAADGAEDGAEDGADAAAEDAAGAESETAPESESAADDAAEGEDADTP